MNDPLQAIPISAPHVEARADQRQCLQLRKTRHFSGGLGGRIAAALRAPAHIELQLDEQGAFFWQQIDGQRSLAEIATAIGRRYAVSDTASRDAVLQFTKALMQRQFIQLRIDDPSEIVRGSPDPSEGDLRPTRRRGRETGAEPKRAGAA